MGNAERALQKALAETEDAAIRWPTFDQQAEWAQRVNNKEQLIHGCFCFADGKNYAVQEPSNSDVQNAYYNGIS